MIWTCLDVQSLRSYYLSIFHWRRPSSNRHDACSMMMQLAANPSDLSKMMRISGLTRRQINHFAHYLPRQGVGTAAHMRARRALAAHGPRLDCLPACLSKSPVLCMPDSSTDEDPHSSVLLNNLL